MALRRLVILTVLVGLAASLRPQAVQRSVTATGRGGWVSLIVLGVLTVPVLVLVVVAGIRYRPHRVPRETTPERRSRGNPWLGVMILLGLLAIAVTTTILLRPTRSDPPADPPPTEPPPADPGTPSEQPWFLVALGILAIILAAAVLFYRRRTSPSEPEPERGTPLAAAVERALRAVAEPTRDPRIAIINCYAAMEDALGDFPGVAPHPADSPTEVLDRATAAGAVRSPSAGRLVELFDEARFSAHPMTEPDRAAAESSLRVILADLGGQS
jgi:hypothetical protein